MEGGPVVGPLILVDTELESRSWSWRNAWPVGVAFPHDLNLSQLCKCAADENRVLRSLVDCGENEVLESEHASHFRRNCCRGENSERSIRDGLPFPEEWCKISGSGKGNAYLVLAEGVEGDVV